MEIWIKKLLLVPEHSRMDGNLDKDQLVPAQTENRCLRVLEIVFIFTALLQYLHISGHME